MITLTKGQCRELEQALRAAADNLVYVIEECRDPNLYIDMDVVLQLQEAQQMLDQAIGDTHGTRRDNW